MMKRIVAKLAVLLGLLVSLVAWMTITAASHAHADYFNYPCQPPGQGSGAQVNVIISAGGQFCDGPTEVNLSHLHCESGGGGINGGAIGLAPSIGGLTFGGFGGSGFGGQMEGCHYLCPDGSIAPAPNPPGVGAKEYLDVRAVIKKGTAFCVKEGHLTSNGPTSDLVSPDEGMAPDDPKPWQVGDPNVKLPEVPPPHPTNPVPEQTKPEGEIPVPEVPALPSLPPVTVPTVPSIPNPLS